MDLVEGLCGVLALSLQSPAKRSLLYYLVISSAEHQLVPDLPRSPVWLGLGCALPRVAMCWGSPQAALEGGSHHLSIRDRAACSLGRVSVLCLLNSVPLEALSVRRVDCTP